MIAFMIEPEIKQHLTDHTKVAHFVAEMRKLGMNEKDTYVYAVRLFIVDLDVLSEVIKSKHHSQGKLLTDQRAPRSWWSRLTG